MKKIDRLKNNSQRKHGLENNTNGLGNHDSRNLSGYTESSSEDEIKIVPPLSEEYTNLKYTGQKKEFVLLSPFSSRKKPISRSV